MQRLTALVVLLVLFPVAGAASLQLTDPHVTVGSVSVDPDASSRPAGAPEGAWAEKPEAADRRVRVQTPDRLDPLYEAATQNPYVQISFGDVEYLLGIVSTPAPRYALLPGSEISIPLTTREVVAAPKPLPTTAPKVAPLTTLQQHEPVEAQPRATTEPRPAAPAPVPVATQSADAEAAPENPWPERAVYAGAAAVLVLAPLALYHRLRGSTVLGHDSRAKLLELLRTRPGLTPADAARELGVDPSTALYHLRRLVKEGIAATDGERRGARYFAAGTVAPADRTRVVFERESADLLTAIRAEPGTSKTSLAGRLAIARATLHWHLTRLERAGLVRCERAGREVRVFPSQEGFSAGPA